MICVGPAQRELTGRSSVEWHKLGIPELTEYFLHLENRRKRNMPGADLEDLTLVLLVCSLRFSV